LFAFLQTPSTSPALEAFLFLAGLKVNGALPNPSGKAKTLLVTFQCRFMDNPLSKTLQRTRKMMVPSSQAAYAA
jgi:hypothetical protein